MLAGTQTHATDECGPAAAMRDYERVREAIAYVSEHWRAQPSLEEIAAHAGLSPAHFQRLFTRWAGISPKEFLQAITIDHARELLRESASILEASYELGLSGPGRLHDLFVDHEAMTPGEYKRRGEGLDIVYGFHASPFGEALVMCTPRGLAGLAFADADTGGREAALADMTSRWPGASYREAPEATARQAERIFQPQRWKAEDPLKVVLIGTDFEIRVWEELLKVPMGRAVSYGDLAAKVCSPAAARAVGTAVGRNPISFVVPCHRVMRKGGGLGGYHWGITRKQAIIGWEAGRVGSIR
ncbi:MAG: methylated-DNA--[protein]-cysteine S-methyltransferase [Hyphomicrobiales bacterium]